MQGYDESNINYDKIDILPIIRDGNVPSLTDLIGPQSNMIFNLNGLSEEQGDWMNVAETYWRNMTGFKMFKEFASKLPVTNDSAKRNVKLIQEYVKSCHDEPLKQDLLLALDSTKRKAGRPKASLKKNIKL